MDLTAGIAISLHLLMEGNYNPIHPYVQLEQNSLAAGAYYNSERNMSMYISKTFTLYKDYELELGAVTGYSDADILPMVRLKKDNFFIAPALETRRGEKNYGLIIGYQF